MTTKERKPMTFGGTMLASAVGFLIAWAICTLIMIFITIGMLAGIAAHSPKQDTEAVREGTFLQIDLATALQERSPSELQRFLASNKMLGLNDMVAAIAAAQDDDRIVGIYLKGSGVSLLGWGSAEELRNALAAFRSSGKPVVAYGNGYGQAEYYVASAANWVAVHPSGMVDFRGIGGEVMFYKDLLQRLGVEMQLIRPENCDYKSAGESYTMDHLSPYNKEQIRAYTSSIWRHVAAKIGTARGLSVDRLNVMADSLLATLPQDAARNHLVDTLCFAHDARQRLKDQYGGERLMDIGNYMASRKAAATAQPNRIAVIYAQGNVLDGKGTGWDINVYGDAVAKALDDAAKDDKVKAIVLRVNSPGGSAIASETMTAAMRRAKEKKPVVVSMGDVAASAGYEMSCFATKIVAQPTTITGSIGVFGTLPNAQRLLNDKLGIKTDTVKTNANANGISLTRPLSPAARTLMQRNVEEFYVTFTQRVADGRGLRRTYVDSIARGRVWSGEDALRIGLVDTLGGMQLALRLAAAEAGIERYSQREYPRQRPLWEDFMSMGSNGDEDGDLRQGLLRKMLMAWQLHGKRHTMALPTRLERDLSYVTTAQGLQARMEMVEL